MKIKGIILHNGKRIPISEHSIEEIVFQHKDGKSQLRLSIIANDEPLMFTEDMIDELTIAHIKG